MLNRINRQKGFSALFITILIMVVISGIATSIYISNYNEQKISRNIIKSPQAYYAAEAGIEDSVYRIIKGKKYEATNNLTVGEGTANVSITSEDGKKIIKSTGEISQRIRILETVLSTETATISFHYGAQADKGGLWLGANASVEGNIYSNGSITGQGKGSGSKITGDAWVAGAIAPTPDQQCTITNADFLFGFPNKLDVAQSFRPSESNVLRKISIYVKKVGNPADRTIRIIIDKNGNPDKNGTIGTGILYASRVGTGYGWLDISLQNPVNLTADAIYWLMIENSTFPLDFNNYYIWGEDKNGSYLRGVGKWSDDWDASNPYWYSIVGDLNFKTWMGGETPTYIDRVWINIDAHANTITDSWIDGDAYYQIIDNKTKVGPSGTVCPNPNCHPDASDPSNKDLPISYAQIQDWEAVAEDGGVISGNHAPLEGTTLGPIKIEGDLTFPSNSDDNPVIITGPVWVTGKILASNNTGIKLKQDLESGYPIIADNPADQNNFGKIEFDNNVITTDSPHGGRLLFISTNKSLVSDNPAIHLHNNVNVNNPQSIIYTLNGLIVVENNAEFVEVTGYGIRLKNNAKIVYQEGLINSNFSSGPGGGWAVDSWKEIE